jgi:hypothetical protein
MAHDSWSGVVDARPALAGKLLSCRSLDSVVILRDEPARGPLMFMRGRLSEMPETGRNRGYNRLLRTPGRLRQ